MECPHCGEALTAEQIKSLWAQLCNALRWKDRKPSPSMDAAKSSMDKRRKRSMDTKKPSMEPSMDEFAELPASEKIRYMREHPKE